MQHIPKEGFSEKQVTEQGQPRGGCVEPEDRRGFLGVAMFVFTIFDFSCLLDNVRVVNLGDKV